MHLLNWEITAVWLIAIWWNKCRNSWAKIHIFWDLNIVLNRRQMTTATLTPRCYEAATGELMGVLLISFSVKRKTWSNSYAIAESVRSLIHFKTNGWYWRKSQLEPVSTTYIPVKKILIPVTERAADWCTSHGNV